MKKTIEKAEAIVEPQSLNAVLSGVSGEYFVAAELSKRGYIASITLRNTKGVDILCSNEDATKTASIQVKTTQKSSRQWLLNDKSEKHFADNFFYVFVSLNDKNESPEYFIVPSKIVSTYVTEAYLAFRKPHGKSGKAGNETTMREFLDPNEKYLDRWDLLNLKN